MLHDFKEINKYVELSREINDNNKNSMENFADQKVPQTNYMTGCTQVMFPVQMSSQSQLPLTVTEFEIGDLAPLVPNNANKVTHVTDFTQNVTNTNGSTADQRVYTAESPKVFQDLDNVNEQDVSLYDHNVNIKEEKVYVNCSSGQNSHAYSYPMYADYSIMSPEEVHSFSPPLPEEYPNDVKMEAADADFSETIVLALKREISEVCKRLAIFPEPSSWTVDDARKWIMWHVGDYSASLSVLEQFSMTGADLCRLTSDEFQMKFPEWGKNLHAQLDVWKNACKLSGPSLQQTTDNYSPNPNQMFTVINDSYTNWPHPALSPTPSISSEDSSSSSVVCHSSDDERQNFYSRVTQPRRHVESHQKQTIHLWEFLKELLLQPESYSNCIKWVDRERGVFKIEDSSRVARLWGKRKNRPAMNYDKLSRSIRQYYKKNIIKKTENSKRLVYQFCVPYL